MPHLSYDANSMPTPEEFRKALKEMAEQYDPVGDLLYLQCEMLLLEQKYQVSSEECYRLFYEGKTACGSVAMSCSASEMADFISTNSR